MKPILLVKSALVTRLGVTPPHSASDADGGTVTAKKLPPMAVVTSIHSQFINHE